MNTQQLKEILKKDPIARYKFCGVYAENTLPKTLDVYPCGLIANTDPKGKPGKHWVAFYFSSPHEGEFFDSYGYPPSFYSSHFESFLNRNAKEWIYNHRQLQSTFTTVCGEYCILYLSRRARGVSMNRIVTVFSDDKELNDHWVYHIVMR